MKKLVFMSMVLLLLVMTGCGGGANEGNAMENKPANNTDNAADEPMDQEPMMKASNLA